ncbi:arylamine N-acetyltransferase family protein [Halorubellus salinus]|uniref:arylamine N-acetyltransferase family protein n=1 Tax=Halorubellus salinus TaxID=755309 RepID=UPI001D065BF2|nr:arylamine N-acetyltransferase [Halorubellus salinus]
MTDRDRPDAIDVDAYLDRIDADVDSLPDPDYETLSRLQAAHVQHVPFENLAIVGHPHREDDRTGDADDGTVLGDGVALDTDALFEKIVERERGGYCFELNGLFHALLASLGYDVDRVAARVVGRDGDARPPANHHANVVHLHRPFVVDVGTGTPQLRQPVPLDGTEVTDDAGVAWRVVDSDRVDAEYETQYREPHQRDWTTRYVFDTTPRDLSYFDATNDYLQTSPESPFATAPTLAIATPDGYRRLDANTHTLVTFHDADDGTSPGPDSVGRDDRTRIEKRTRERPVPPGDWALVAASTFGVDVE